MVWGCMSSQGVGALHIIKGTVKSTSYKLILSKCLRPSIPRLQSTYGEYIFQQDNAPCHKSKAVMKYLSTKSIPILPWPSNSPDLSTIENLWGKIKKSLRKESVYTMAALTDRLTVLWASITPEECKNLVSTIPNRIENVIKAREDATKY